MDAWEPERPSASKSAFARGFACRHVQDSANPRASPGGTSEPFDADRDATLAREAFEENTVRIAPSPAYLGYQEVRQPGRPVIAQVRMAGIITEFAARAPDPDNGRLNRRYMTSLAAAPTVLGWGQPAEAQARAAAEAGRRWGLPVDHPAADGYED
jgi:8-oxo-dGTP diphosphatase